MEDIQLLVDMFKRVPRQGPGSPALTSRLLDTYIKPHIQDCDESPYTIADLGCGAGLSTLQLAATSGTRISAVDLMPEFLTHLTTRASQNLLTNLTTHQASIDELPFEHESFNAIWSEGAIYNIGFENGIQYWRDFLKPNGLMIVTEITWLTHERPAELNEYWTNQYPEIDTASNKIAQLEQNGYQPVAYSVIPNEDWLTFYRSLDEQYTPFLKDHQNSPNATQLVNAMKEEADVYTRYQDFFSYGIYVASKRD